MRLPLTLFATGRPKHSNFLKTGGGPRRPKGRLIEALDPDKLERLGRYEVHLDRKLERMLAMLLGLKTLTAEPTWRPFDGNPLLDIVPGS